jgi:hypothetical protein
VALIDKKITAEQISSNGVVSAPDRLEGTPAENKAVFDKLIKDIVAVAANGVIDELIGAAGAANIGAAVTGVNGNNVQAVLDGIKLYVDQKIIAAGAMTSFNGRNGAVSPASGDYNTDMITETANKKMIPTAGLSSGNILKWDGSKPIPAVPGTDYADGTKINQLINSGFDINQRGLSSYSSGKYTFDRWYNVNCGAVTRETNTSPAPVQYMCKVAMANNSYNVFSQPIENYVATYPGKTVTFSAWVKTDVAGSVRIGIGQSGGRTFNVGTDWTLCKATVTPDTSSVWYNGLAFGSTVNTNIPYTAIWIAAPQVVFGSTISDYQPKIYANELADCYRYYQANTSRLFGIHCPTASRVYFYAQITPMRVSPTLGKTSYSVDVFNLGSTTFSVSENYGTQTNNAIALMGTLGSAFGSAAAHPIVMKDTITLDAEIYS